MKILVAVPIFNEEKYVERVLREIRKYERATAVVEGVELRVLVVDDGSTDGTPAVLRDLARHGHIELITHPENRGYGQSLIDAFSFAAEGAVAEREAAVLRDAGLSADAFAGFGKLLQGTRRHNLVYLDDLAAQPHPDGVQLTFTLPAGGYATVLLREVTKSTSLDANEEA